MIQYAAFNQVSVSENASPFGHDVPSLPDFFVSFSESISFVLYSLFPVVKRRSIKLAADGKR